MLEANTKIVNLNPLTPRIQLFYAGFTQIETGIQENTGYFVFQAKSKISGEIHHIRAFNLSSPFAQQDTDSTDKATTIFLQETLRLCSLNPEAIVLDTFEFYKNKICYAVKPVISPVITSTPKLDVKRLLQGLIADLKCLSQHGHVHLHTARIHQIEKTYAPENENCLPWYFMQDWNQILWQTSKNMESHLEGQNKRQIIDTSLQFAETNEKENMYHLAMSILEISGLKRKELQSLLLNSGSFYSRASSLVLEDPQFANLNLTLEDKELLMAMVNEDGSKRPSLEEIFVRIQKIQSNYKEDLAALTTRSTSVDANLLGQSAINIRGETRIVPQKRMKHQIIIFEESKSAEITEEIDKKPEITGEDNRMSYYQDNRMSYSPVTQKEKTSPSPYGKEAEEQTILNPKLKKNNNRLTLTKTKSRYSLEFLIKNTSEKKVEMVETDIDMSEVPEEFICPISGDIMQDPVMLPSSKVILDKGSIKQILLNGEFDPFNRAPLKFSEVIELTDLKKKIETWTLNKKEEKKKAALQKNQKMDVIDAVYASKQTGGSGIKINWPNQPQGSNVFQSNNRMEDEDIYS